MGLTGPLPERFLRRIDPKDRAGLGKAGLTASEAASKAQKRLEREEQRIFARELTRLELPFYWHRVDKPTGATVGVPDFIIGVAGETLWIEFKAQGGVLSDDQCAFLLRLGRQGIKLHVCRSAAEGIELVNHQKKDF